jgi:hypothetical protein
VPQSPHDQGEELAADAGTGDAPAAATRSWPASTSQPGPRGPAAAAVVRPGQAAPVQPRQRRPAHPVSPRTSSSARTTATRSSSWMEQPAAVSTLRRPPGAASTRPSCPKVASRGGPSRARWALGGTIRVRSPTGQGTRLQIDLPIQDRSSSYQARQDGCPPAQLPSPIPSTYPFLPGERTGPAAGPPPPRASQRGAARRSAFSSSLATRRSVTSLATP